MSNQGPVIFIFIHSNMPRKKEINTEYEQWKERHKFSTTPGNRELFDAVKKVRDLYSEALLGRQNNCYWFKNTDEDTTSTGGGDWGRWWDRQEKAWNMWYQPMSEDNFRSNLKAR